MPRPGLGRPRKKPDSLAADKAYSNGPIREYLRRRGIHHTIPEKTDSQAARLRKGSRGGRPPAFDEDRYKKRNTIERAINYLKQSQAVATRYDKRGYVYLGTATATAAAVTICSGHELLCNPAVEALVLAPGPPANESSQITHDCQRSPCR